MAVSAQGRDCTIASCWLVSLDLRTSSGIRTRRNTEYSREILCPCTRVDQCAKVCSCRQPAQRDWGNRHSLTAVRLSSRSDCILTVNQHACTALARRCQSLPLSQDDGKPWVAFVRPGQGRADQAGSDVDLTVVAAEVQPGRVWTAPSSQIRYETPRMMSQRMLTLCTSRLQQIHVMGIEPASCPL